MEDDKSSVASSYVDSEDLLTSFQMVPEPGFHYRVLVVRSSHPMDVTLNIANGCAEFKELKSCKSDSDCIMTSLSTSSQHLGTLVDASRAKAIWDTINGNPKKLSRDTIAPDGASSPASSFAVIDDEQEDSFERDLHRSSLAAAGRSSIPISDNSSFARIKESEDEKDKVEEEQEKDDDYGKDEDYEGYDDYEDYEDVIDEDDDSSSEEDIDDDEAHKDEPQDLAVPRMSRYESMSSDAQLVALLRRCGNNIHDFMRNFTETEKTIIVNAYTCTPTKPGALAEQENYFKNLFYLTIEFIVKVLEAFKRKDKSPSAPTDITVEFLKTILNSNAFLDITEQHLEKILTIKRNDPLVEDQLAKFLVKWSQIMPSNYLKLPKFLGMLRLSILPPEKLIELSKMEPIHESILCRDVIDLAKNGLLMLISKPMDTHNYIYMLTNDKLHPWENQIHQINLTTHESKLIATRQAILLASLRNCLFVFARRNLNQRAIDVFEFEDRKWYPMSNWPVDLVISSMCTYNRCIYFIASIGTSHNFYKYDPSIDEFRMILPPSNLVIKENSKIIPFDKHILFIPSGVAYDIVNFKWHNYVPFAPHAPVKILAVYQNLLIYPAEDETLLFFDPKKGTYGNHSNWSSIELDPFVPAGQLIDLTVVNGTFYLIEKCPDGTNIKFFDDNHWFTKFSVDLSSDPLRCAISTDDF